MREQSIAEFYKRGNIADKEYLLCKTCRGKGQKAYYKSHKEECNRLSRQRNDMLRLRVFRHYSGEPPYCALCGENDPLVLNLDHIDGGGEQHRQSINKMGHSFYYWIRQQEYPTGYQVLCANCNTRKWKQQLRGIE